MKCSTLLFLLVLFLFAVVHPSLAIHEDEQGLRDWILRFVGHVDHASYQPGLQPNHVYLVSKPGAVAALSLSDGGLQWRKLLSEPQVCVAASKNEVLVSSRSGTVHLLNAANGEIERTFKLSLPIDSTVESCAIVEGKVRVAAMDTITAYIYEFGLVTEDDMMKPRNNFPIGTDVHALRISGKHIWALRTSSANRYSLTGDVEMTDVEGGSYGSSVTASGDAVVFSGTRIAVVRDDGKTENTACENCDVGVLYSTTGKFEGTVKTTADKLGFTVFFPGSNVHVAYDSAAIIAPTVLLAVRDRLHGAQVILRTYNGHILAVSEKSGKMWERLEGLAHLSATVIADNPVHEDHFSFNKVALAISTYGVFYAIPISEMGHNIRVLSDISDVILQKTAAFSMESVKIERMFLSGTNVVTVVVASPEKRVSLAVDYSTGSVTEVKVHENSLFVSPTFEVTRSLELHGAVSYNNMHFFTANVSSGLIEGYAVSASSEVVPLWTVRMPYPLVAYATGEDILRTKTVNHLRVFPNKTSQADEVRRKYPTRNVFVVAHYEPSEDELTTLVVTAIDSVTGSVLATARHRNVEGPVHMLVVEHAVLYYYMDMEKVRHCIGVWEMFEEEPGRVLRKDAGATIPQVIASFFSRFKRTFSSRATRPPVVTVAVLGVYGGNLATMGVTTSFNGISRKSVVLAFDSGRIATVELNRLLAGGQLPLDDKGNQATHAIIPSTSLASHKLRVAKPSLIATTPTNLESSCHVLVSGLDIFYVRASSGKAFDLLNSDFNKNLLITLTCGFGVLTCAARYFVSRKALNLLWK
ncbi:putative PQQ-like domain/Protein of unknown function (DUF1620) [Trypanosoma cruzi]|nr:putative PQQ-like domain/Protein of unknown function (DUF1620) [Trypanosoma cruzi]